jgi:hypothetical protein
MRRVAWAVLVVLLAAGFGAGYAVRGMATKARTTTVVQEQTVAPPPPATRVLDAEVRGPSGGCMTTDSNRSNILQDTFTLRSPGNGLTEGGVVATAEKLAFADCQLEVYFKISPNLGFFDVTDEQTSDQWGPFDSRQLAARDWTLELNESS